MLPLSRLQGLYFIICIRKQVSYLSGPDFVKKFLPLIVNGAPKLLNPFNPLVPGSGFVVVCGLKKATFFLSLAGSYDFPWYLVLPDSVALDPDPGPYPDPFPFSLAKVKPYPAF